jgi:hypothetical protein
MYDEKLRGLERPCRCDALSFNPQSLQVSSACWGALLLLVAHPPSRLLTSPWPLAVSRVGAQLHAAGCFVGAGLFTAGYRLHGSGSGTARPWLGEDCHDWQCSPPLAQVLAQACTHLHRRLPLLRRALAHCRCLNFGSGATSTFPRQRHCRVWPQVLPLPCLGLGLQVWILARRPSVPSFNTLDCQATRACMLMPPVTSHAFTRLPDGLSARATRTVGSMHTHLGGLTDAHAKRLG